MLGLIDESVPISALGIHYVMSAAVLLDPAQHDDVRGRAARVIGRRGRPFHWKDEGVVRRRAMIQLLGELEIGVFATIHRPVSPDRQRQARRAVLTDLVMRLDKEGVNELFIESRGPTLDVEDHHTLLDARHDGLCSGEVIYCMSSTSAGLTSPETRTSPGSRPSRTRRSLGAGAPGLHFRRLSANGPNSMPDPHRPVSRDFGQ